MTNDPHPAHSPSPCEQFYADVQKHLAAGDYQRADELLACLGIPSAERGEMLKALEHGD
jgi:hypothetical protein